MKPRNFAIIDGQIVGTGRDEGIRWILRTKGNRSLFQWERGKQAGLRSCAKIKNLDDAMEWVSKCIRHVEETA